MVDDDAGVRDSYRQILTAPPASQIISKGAALFQDTDQDHDSSQSTPYEVILTDCGENGVKAVETAIEEKKPFAATFIDMMMPGIDGAETAKKIWSLDPNIKIVIVTAYSLQTPDDIVRKVKREDLFYLRKPFNPTEIRQFARALTKQWNLEKERQILSSDLGLANQQLKIYAEDLKETFLELRGAHKKLARLRDSEIDTASKIQDALLLGQPPDNLIGIQISHRTIASQRVDGDFYDFYRLAGGLLDVVVGDVMGKGIPAALVGAALKSQLLHVLNNFSQSGDTRKIPEPENIVSSLQTNMIQKLEDLETFVTLCYARFDLARNFIDFVDCGHTQTIHFKKETHTYSLLKGVNMPLGFPEKEAFTQRSVPFKPGDLFIFYSDGLTEAKSLSGEFYGEDRLADFILKNATETPKELIDRIHADIVAFSKSEAFLDDFTCVVVKITDSSSNSEILSEAEIELKSDFYELERARVFTRKFCENITGTPLNQTRIEQLVLAVSETATNIIKHAYHEKPGQRIQIHATYTTNQIVLHFFDWGREAFSPGPGDFDLPDDTSLSGRGLFIIKNSVDGVEFSRDESGKNCTTLISKLPIKAT